MSKGEFGELLRAYRLIQLAVSSEVFDEHESALRKESAKVEAQVRVGTMRATEAMMAAYGDDESKVSNAGMFVGAALLAAGIIGEVAQDTGMSEKATLAIFVRLLMHGADEA